MNVHLDDIGEPARLRRPDYAVAMTTPPMATPRMAAGVLFRDRHGRVLLVKPSYKEGWDIPGGYVEPGESPKHAARREVLEELGIEPSIGRLLVIDWAPGPNEGDKVLFIFDGGRLDETHLSSPAPDEIKDIRFWDSADLSKALPARLHDRLANALRAHIEDTYLEHGIATDA
jgi:8-oxo-dGTP diphosphatase